jgi:molybdenum transport protein
LGLSEPVLVFRLHTAFLDGMETFLSTTDELLLKASKTEIIAEAGTGEEALLVALSGADIVQLDKIAPAELADAVSAIREANRTS